MSSELALIPTERSEVSLGTLHAENAGGLVTAATEMATALADVIERQKLYSTIQGRRHVRVEGWTTLCVMLGCTPREISNVASEDGSYVATVELVRMRDGAVLSRATSECGMDEPTWANRARYARRSMAATRATGKACRLAFSWVMALAGYDPTPLEEMPQHDAQEAPKRREPTFERAAAPAGIAGISHKQAGDLMGLCRSRSDELGADGIEVHGFAIASHVLKDLGLEPLPKGKMTDAIRHLGTVLSDTAAASFERAVQSYRPSKEEAPF